MDSPARVDDTSRLSDLWGSHELIVSHGLSVDGRHLSTRYLPTARVLGSPGWFHTPCLLKPP